MPEPRILDVRDEPPARRHALILETFDAQRVRIGRTAPRAGA